MDPRLLVDAGLWSGVRIPSAERPRTTAAFQRGVACALATAVAAEAQDQRVSQRIKDRQTERYRYALGGRPPTRSLPDLL